ncbi:PREDICTED: uncharacterized protein LOC105451753 [Wasmannia auropunctata]|uniref:uncharacterized protein LOC105451753 n=1 Tax=Wasmannia auropunctata TaxID=64793 RepID=UPI0005EF6C25|nr:PREDICTED: uncharacterized protein LOC105451753 [Wasmannia auropunctata]
MGDPDISGKMVEHNMKNFTMENGVYKGPINHNLGKYKSVGEMLWTSITNNREKIAHLDARTDETVTYAELQDKIVRCALWLQKQGITSDDVISICTDNHFNSIVPCLSTAYINAIFNVWNDNMSLSTALYFLQLITPKVIFCNEKSVSVILSAIKEANYSSTTVVVFGKHVGAISFSDILKDFNNMEVANFRYVELDDIKKTACILHSSGTTGMPKGVELSHYAILSLSQEEKLNMTDVPSLWFSTLFWLTGIMMNFSTILRGSKVILYPEFNEEMTCRLIEKYKVAIVFLSVSMVNRLVKAGYVKKYSLSSLKLIMCGGAIIKSEVHEELRNILPHVHILHGYGLTEACGIVTVQLPYHKSGSCGTVVKNVQIKIVDPESGKVLGPNQSGEIWIKTAIIMTGYYKNPEATKNTIDEEGWFHSGDIGYIDEDGELFIIDRIKELIKYRGIQISPGEIENVLISHPAVLEAAVVRIPHPLDDEHPLAYVTKKSGYEVTEKELIDFVAKNMIDHYKLRAGVIFLDSFPYTGSGKISRKDLRELTKKLIKSDTVGSHSESHIYNLDLNISAKMVENNLKDFTVENGIYKGQVKDNVNNYKSLGELIWVSLKRHGDKIAYLDARTDETITYAELHDRVVRCALWLQKQGIKSGDIISMCTGNHLNSVVPCLSTAYINAIFNTWNENMDLQTTLYFLQMMTPKIIFCSEKSVDVVLSAIKEKNYNATVVVFGKHTGAISFSDILRNCNDTEVTNFRYIELDDIKKTACILHSSGTTGMPKGVELSNCAVLIVSQQITTNTANVPSIWFSTLFWITGLFMNFSGIVQGTKAIIYPEFEEEMTCRLIEKYKIQVAFFSTSIISRLLKSGCVQKYPLSSLKTILAGGTSIMSTVQEEMKRILPHVQILQCYGMTELGNVGAMQLPNHKKNGSCGIVAQNVQMKIVDPESGKILDPNQPGEICMKIPSLMNGYYKNPEATKNTIDKEGWLHSGDIGYIDEDGELFIIDRLKDLIKYRGYQIFPGEIENVLLSHPAVLETAVIGVPHAIDDEHPLAFITKRPGAKVTEQELIDLVAKNMMDHFKLRAGVIFLDSFPYTATGKISKKNLKEMTKDLIIKHND